MRIAVVSSHPIQYYSPLFRELSKHVDLRVFFAHKATAEQQAAAGFGKAFDWDVDLFSGFDHRFLRNVAAQPSASRFGGCDTPGIAEELANGRFDAVLVTGWHLKSYWQTVWAARRQGIPVLVRGDSHLGTARSRLTLAAKALLYPGLLRAFDAILYTGQKNKAYLDHYRYPEHRQFFSPHCVDTTWFRDRATIESGRSLRASVGIPADASVLLFAGKLLPLKRPLDVVAIAQRLAERGAPVHVLVAGSGELGPAMAEAAAAARVQLHALGFCNQSKMPAVYAAADALVLSSEWETWGLVANEALASGTPVLLSEAVGSSLDLAAFPAVVAQYPCGDVDRAVEAVTPLLETAQPMSAFEAVNARYGLAQAAFGIIDAASASLRGDRKRSAKRPRGMAA